MEAERRPRQVRARKGEVGGGCPGGAVFGDTGGGGEVLA